MDLGNNVHLVKGWPWAGNIYIINENLLTLIDTSMYRFKLNKLEKTLKEIGRKIEDIELILHTHGHIDHIGNTFRIKEKSHAITYGHKMDEDHFNQLHKYKGVKNFTGFLENFGSAVFSILPPVIDKYLFGDEYFDLLGGLRVIHAPGHTSGSVCYYSEKYGILFSGDALQQKKGRIIRAHRFIYSEDAEREEKSVKKLLELDFDKLFSGHHHIIFKDASNKLRKNY